MPSLIKDLEITEVSSVDRGAGLGVEVMLSKRDKGSEMESVAKVLEAKSDAEVIGIIKDKAAAAGRSFIDMASGRNADAFCKSLYAGVHEREQIAKGVRPKA